MMAPSDEDPSWVSDLNHVLRGERVRVWSGQSSEMLKAEDDPFSPQKTLRRPVEFEIPDPRMDCVYSGRMFSLCILDGSDRVIAAAGIDCEPHTGLFWVDSIFVSKDHRRHGLGTDLITAAAKVFQDLRRSMPDKPWIGVEMDAITSGGRAISETAARLSLKDSDSSFSFS